jgi:hypothetical protein
MSRLSRGLVALCVLAAAWAALLALTGGFDLAVGPVRVSSRSPLNPLLVAIASGLGAWSVSIRAERASGVTGPHHGVRFVLLLACLVAGLNVLMLAQPAPPSDENNCLFHNPIRHGFRHLLNCDSPEFLALAQEPSLVFVRPTRQGRPLSFALPYVLARALALVPGVEETWPYRPYAAEFAAFIVINGMLLVAALALFTSVLESGTGARAGSELLPVLVALAVNDVTKLFFLTPHTQIYNLFVPCLSLYLAYHLTLRERALAAGQALGLGLGLGVGLLAYGSFAVAILCAAAIQLLVHRSRGPALAIGAGALLPYAGWALFVWGRTGGFHQEEIEGYRQFIWIADCAALGAAACAPVVRDNLTMFVTAAAPVVAVPLLLALGLRVARHTTGSGQRPSSNESRALHVAMAVNLVVTALFLAMMGFYVPRLMWLMVPELLLVIAVEIQALRLWRAAPAGWRVDAAMLLATLAYLALLVSRQGPYT